VRFVFPSREPGRRGGPRISVGAWTARATAPAKKDAAAALRASGRFEKWPEAAATIAALPNVWMLSEHNRWMPIFADRRRV